jgi:hypothetical protein
MATFVDVVNIARNYLRDFPKFFQVSFDALGRTYQLGHTNVDADSLWVASYIPNTPSASVTAIAATGYTLDSRNGIMRLNNPPTSSSKIMVEGYYYEWVTPDDLAFYAKKAVEKHLDPVGFDLTEVSDAVINAIGISAICESLWALMTEYSRDIDVITSESVHIPASQRFRMVQALLAQWEEEYKRHATALNIGIDRMEVFSLRRISRTTGYLVPLYKAREIGEYSPVERLWPRMDSGIINQEIKEEPMRTDVYVDGPPPSGQTTTVYY